MKTFAVLAVICLLGLLAMPTEGQVVLFTRNSLYRFATPAQCTGLLNLRRGLIAKSCKGCVATPVVWNGPGIGYSVSDYNCLIKTSYPSAPVFTAYQAVEKTNAAYQAGKKLATLNANFMQKGK